MNQLDRNNAILAVIDVQERLMAAIHGAAEVEANVARLIRGSRVLAVPAIVTEQYPKGIGPTTAIVREAMSEAGVAEPLQKMCFSSFGADEFARELRHAGRRQVILCGVEAHVCVYQTCRDLLGEGYEVHIVGDAISSRTVRNRDLALQRMALDGAHVTTTEMALFELTGAAGTDEFRAISKLVK